MLVQVASTSQQIASSSVNILHASTVVNFKFKCADFSEKYLICFNMIRLSRQELLRGPLLYITIVVSVTLLFWRESPIGLLVLCLMCGGDGLAHIVGRRYGSAKLPFNHSKSWVGSLAMFTGK